VCRGRAGCGRAATSIEQRVEHGLRRTSRQADCEKFISKTNTKKLAQFNKGSNKHDPEVIAVTAISRLGRITAARHPKSFLRGRKARVRVAPLADIASEVATSEAPPPPCDQAEAKAVEQHELHTDLEMHFVRDSSWDRHSSPLRPKSVKLGTNGQHVCGGSARGAAPPRGDAAQPRAFLPAWGTRSESIRFGSIFCREFGSIFSRKAVLRVQWCVSSRGLSEAFSDNAKRTRRRAGVGSERLSQMGQPWRLSRSFVRHVSQQATWPQGDATASAPRSEQTQHSPSLPTRKSRRDPPAFVFAAWWTSSRRITSDEDASALEELDGLA
jgi:hypothetical protein